MQRIACAMDQKRLTVSPSFTSKMANYECISKSIRPDKEDEKDEIQNCHQAHLNDLSREHLVTSLASPMIISSPSSPSHDYSRTTGHTWTSSGSFYSDRHVQIERVGKEYDNKAQSTFMFHPASSVNFVQKPVVDQNHEIEIQDMAVELANNPLDSWQALGFQQHPHVFLTSNVLTYGHQHPGNIITGSDMMFHDSASQAHDTLSSNDNVLPIFSNVTPSLFTLQDLPVGSSPPIFNMINPNYPGSALIHADPPIFSVQNFLTPEECDYLIHLASDSFGPAPVVGKGFGEISASRTSSTCYLAREDVPGYMNKVTTLIQKPINHCELPQIGRYLPTQQYLQHYDAFDLSNQDGLRFAVNGGQRVATVLVYLNTVSCGGCTYFPRLNLRVTPIQGLAVIFFPATMDGYLDQRVLHAAEPAIDTKYVSQVWIRQGAYHGQASKRVGEKTWGVENPRT